MLLLLAAILVALAIGAVLLAMPAIYGWGVYRRFHEKRTVICPETHAGATVRGDAFGAASSAMYGDPRLRLVACSRWPARRGCGQECVVQILEEPTTDKGGFQVFPVLVGAMAAWALAGAVGYSPAVRAWIVSHGVPSATVQQGYELVLPALLPLIIAIGIGFVIQFALRQRHYTLLGGAAIGTIVGLALAAAALPFARGATALVLVYAGFAVAVSALMGMFFTAWRSVANRY